MTADSTPSQPSFPQAMEIAAQWLGLWEAAELSDEVLADRVGSLVASRDGARGFFVVALAGDSPVLDRLPEALVGQLRDAGEGVVDLTARNLAMATAMALHHRRQGDVEQAERSERVRERSAELLRRLDPLLVKSRLDTLLLAARDGEGSDQSFLDRWGYDDDQRQAIAESVLAVAD
jgi:hypothetical protein